MRDEIPNTTSTKTQRQTMIILLASLILSLAITVISYNFSYMEPNIVDVAIVYRGWPFYWIIETWSFWSPLTYPHAFAFQPLNFLIDTIFWGIIFQPPLQLYLYLKKQKTPKLSIISE